MREFILSIDSDSVDASDIRDVLSRGGMKTDPVTIMPKESNE
jgi:hypothetical protein